MAFTGRLGSAASRLGAIVLGRAASGSAAFTATAGTVTITGGNAVLIGTSVLGATAGTLTFTGGTALLTVRAPAVAGTLTFTGGTATVLQIASALGVPMPDLQLIIGSGANKRILNGTGKNEVMQHVRWSSIMPGGHHTLEANLRDTERTGNPVTYRYGSGLTLRQAPVVPGGAVESGAILWQGYMVSPVANDDGTFDIVGKGWHHLFLERDEALLWQDRYYGDWQPADADGFTLKNNSDSIDAAVNNASLSFAVKKGGDMDAADRAKLVWYYPTASATSKVLPRRFAATVYKNRQVGGGGTPDYTLELCRYDGPTANVSRAVVQDHVAAMSNNNTGDTGTTIIDAISQTVDHPVISLEFTRQNPTVDAEYTFRTTIRDIRVSDLASGDSYLSSQVVADLGAKMGFTVGPTMVPATTQNILPLFWQEGTWWDLVQYLSVAENTKWAVWENNPNPEIEFRTWDTPGTTWTTNAYGSTATTIAHLAPDDEVWSVVDVAYTKGSSSRVRHVRQDVLPNPFAGLTPPRVRTFRVELQDPQPDETLATSIATTLAAEFGTEQLAGTITGSFFSQGSTPTTCYAVRAGDVVTISDYPGGAKTVRVYGVDHRDDGVSVLTIGRVPSRLDRILFWASMKRRRKGIAQ